MIKIFLRRECIFKWENKIKPGIGIVNILTKCLFIFSLSPLAKRHMRRLKAD